MTVAIARGTIARGTIARGTIARGTVVEAPGELDRHVANIVALLAPDDAIEGEAAQRIAPCPGRPPANRHQIRTQSERVLTRDITPFDDAGVPRGS